MIKYHLFFNNTNLDIVKVNNYEKIILDPTLVYYVGTEPYQSNRTVLPVTRIPFICELEFRNSLTGIFPELFTKKL